MPRRASLRSAGLALCCSVLGGTLAAQGLPPYAPINPIAQVRSGLETLPYVEPGRRWQFTILTDYASLVEFTDLPAISYILDAELHRTAVTVLRNLGGKAFLLAGGSVNGAYDGFLDGFLNWYHELTGLRVKPREVRPKNEFDYQIVFRDCPENCTTEYRPSGTYLGDLRFGAGLRHSRHWQTALWVTLPTSGGSRGFRKEVASINAGTTVRSDFWKRFTYEGTLGVGYTPRHGDFEERQKTTFVMVTQGVRARFAGPVHLYTSFLYHSPMYKGFGARGLDARELSIDVGGFLKFKKGPEWILGMTEDLEPRGPAIDLSFRLGVRW
ncbi:MAG: DUF3187 family protein [Gemmatimonadales bacterium]|nr:DUF3187 family protein [Gemmatimonadales bacterium]